MSGLVVQMAQKRILEVLYCTAWTLMPLFGTLSASTLKEKGHVWSFACRPSYVFLYLRSTVSMFMG